MTDKELKRLSRMELIDIIYELQKQNEQTRAMLNEAQTKLGERTLKIAEAGSIAEAAVQLSGIFEAAQTAADQYLESVRAANQGAEDKLADAEAQKSAILQSAERQAAEILRAAQEQAQLITSQAEKDADQQWDLFQRKAEEFIAAHNELSSFMQK